MIPMIKLFIFICLTPMFLYSANTLTAVTLPDQFETVTPINEETEWIVFSMNHEVSDVINKAIEDLKITDIQSLKGAYVSDISKMPSMISKMIALPKMRKYTFKVLLDKEGDITKTWPRKDLKATIINLKKLEISEVVHTDQIAVIKKFLLDKKEQPIKK